MKKDFSVLQRAENIKCLKHQFFDLIIVGGGITGAGVARDAVSRGLSVALVEQSDFASGTSSRSSKLVHGGIRYLENLEFRLVFEALSERKRLFEMAPHMVHPLRFVLPVYQNSRVGMFKMGLGMWLYDLLSLFDAPQMHETLGREETEERIPELQKQKLSGSFVYSDAYMDDDRLVHATLRSAAQQGACIANYVRAGAALFGDPHIQGIHCEDMFTSETFTIRGRHVVSTVGPWTDQVAENWISDWKSILRPTKGIHITLSRERVPLKSAVVMAVDAEDRIVFGIPRNDMVIIGTTDTDYRKSPADVRVRAEDVRYLLEVARQYFPGLKLTSDDIISAYAGVRPLVHDGSESEGKTSREHTILDDPRGITFVAGGKYTTYRLMAEQIVDRVLDSFSAEDQVAFANSNTLGPLNPLVTRGKLEQAYMYAERWSQSYERKLSEVEQLIDRHGLEAEQFLKSGRGHNYWQIEAMIAIHQTMCVSLTDFYFRRSPLFLGHSDHGMRFLDSICEVFSRELGWDESEERRQRESLESQMSEELSWRDSI